MSVIEDVVWSKSELKKIKTYLPKGWKDVLADEFGIAPGSVKNIMSGISRNDALIMRAISMAEQNKINLLAAKQKASSL